MSKFLKYFIFIIFVEVLSIFNVYAGSIPYDWKVSIDNKIVNVSSGNVSGASLEKNNKEVILTLDNYNGDMLTEYCYGTGISDVTFKVILIGDNIINSKDTYGLFLDSGYNVSFEGSGTLTINASIPLSYLNVSDYNFS